MPLPKPKKNEEKQPFISRCIAKVTKEDADKFRTVNSARYLLFAVGWGMKRTAKHEKGSRSDPFYVKRAAAPTPKQRRELPRQRRNSGEAAAPVPAGSQDPQPYKIKTTRLCYSLLSKTALILLWLIRRRQRRKTDGKRNKNQL